ncbi:MAG TPA: PAS domain-containing protein [Polyangiaceae bacterium]|nr:PAS domain-containing protein [Polyangiaceae bacterium]
MTSDERTKQAVDLFAPRRHLVRVGERFVALREARPAERERERPTLELDAELDALHTAKEELRVQRESLEQAARALEFERARYRELFDFVPDPCLVTGANGKIIAANRAAAGLLNAPAHKLPGRLLVSFVRLSEREAFRERLAAVHEGGRPLRWDATLVPTSRREPPPEVPVTVRVAPSPASGLLWTLRDVTEGRGR